MAEFTVVGLRVVRAVARHGSFSTAAAGLLLALVIYPRQKAALAEPDDGARLRSLAMYAGIYNVLWAVVVVLMIVRPGAR